MPTQITTAAHQDSLSGSSEKRLDIAPDGTLWLAVADTNRVRFFSSANGGASWAVASNSDLAYGSGQDTGTPSFFIDADGYAHVTFVRWQQTPQTLLYARGKPRTGGGWSWTTLTVSPAGGRMNVDSDVIAFRNGTGWVAFVTWSYGSTAGSRVSRIDISASGTLTLGSLVHGPASGDAAWQFGALAYASDSKVPQASSHVFLVTASQTASSPVYAHRAQYSSGSWTWGTPISLATGVTILETVMCCAHDGTRLITAWSPNDTTVKVSQWDGVAGSATAINPPALSQGTVLGVSIAIDPATADIYLVAYDATNGDVFWTKYTRATPAWSAWASLVSRSPSGQDGDVQLVRNPTREAVDLVYATGTSPNNVLWYQRVAGLTRVPAAPTLISPAPGVRADLAAGATFVWQHSKLSPGDSQSQWQLRRNDGATTEYWNDATQTWSGSDTTWNVSTAEQVTFPAAKWTNGTTYSWTVRTRSADGSTSPFAADRTVISTAAPVVVVTAPIGIVYGTSTPTVTWTYSGLKSQRDYEVRILDPAAGAIDPNDPTPAVWTSGQVSSAVARAVAVTTPLPDVNGTYRAYLRVNDTDGTPSVWVYSTFSLSAVPPLGPSLRVEAYRPYETGVPRAKLRLLGRCNYLAEAQAAGGTGWDTVSNATVAAVTENSLLGRLPGYSVTTTGSGDARVRTAVGSPPEAPFGRPALAGPLDFPTIPGVDYTAMASIRVADGGASRAARILIEWYATDDGSVFAPPGVLPGPSGTAGNAVPGYAVPGNTSTASWVSGDSTIVGITIGLQSAVTDAGYVQVLAQAVAPPGAIRGRVVVEILATAGSGEVFYVGKASFAPGRSTEWRPGGNAQRQTVRIERSIDGRVTWEEISSGVKTDYWQELVLDDRTVPFGVTVAYRGWSDIVETSGAKTVSEESLIAEVEVESPTWALRDPAQDATEVLLYVTEYSRAEDDAAVVTWTAGSAYPTVDVEDVRVGGGSLTVYVKQAYAAATSDTLRRATPLVLTSPVGEVLWIRVLNRAYDAVHPANREYRLDFAVVPAGSG